MIKQLLLLDKILTNFFYNLFPHNLFFNQFFSFFSITGYSFLIWLLIIFIIIFFEEKKQPGISKKDKQFIFLFILSILLTFLIIEFPLKNFFQRKRPQENFSFLNLTKSCPNNFSFPSGHAGMAFASSFILSFFDKKRRKFYYLIATLIAFSRIFLGCHYFSDVIGGGLIGILISWLILKLFKKIKIIFLHCKI